MRAGLDRAAVRVEGEGKIAGGAGGGAPQVREAMATCHCQ